MIRTVQIAWQSPCQRGHVEARNGLYWGYVGPDRVCVRRTLDKARAIVERRLSSVKEG